MRVDDGEGGSAAPKLPISPQVGEMSGRTEGGAVEYQRWRYCPASSSLKRCHIHPCRLDIAPTLDRCARS
ncbi:hypothetical protein EH240_35945 [Mesorhizobium tamadayense]|uniref:Propionyl-coenzyme A carboxylase alpha polypeptide n=1 Tax=Mesorhizobium tamadayense TaxID=425306 RepID=A0A3P3EMW0_9HYPH|nr:hypothetical protein EH240_35945 [Mesorhizobium tamadayense]